MVKSLRKQEYYINWLNFGLNYFDAAAVVCENIIGESDTEEKRLKVKNFYIPIIYNVKHATEVLIKCLVLVSERRGITKEDKTHDQYYLFNKVVEKINKINISKIEKIIDDKIKTKAQDDSELYFLKRAQGKFKDNIMSLWKIIRYYYSLTFLKEKISQDYSLFDAENTLFKYPQYVGENPIQVNLNFDKILERVDEKDILNIKQDIYQLEIFFIGIFNILLNIDKK